MRGSQCATSNKALFIHHLNVYVKHITSKYPVGITRVTQTYIIELFGFHQTHTQYICGNNM